jgi:hypothetical protein
MMCQNALRQVDMRVHAIKQASIALSVSILLRLSSTVLLSLLMARIKLVPGCCKKQILGLSEANLALQVF